MPGIQRCFFRTLDYLQQTHPHVLASPGNPHARTAETTPPHRDMHLHRISTHRSSGKARAHAHCPNAPPRPHYSQDPACYARPGSQRPSAVPHSPLFRLRFHNLHHHNHLIRHHHHVLVQHNTPLAAGETSQTGRQTRPYREQPRRCQGPRPDEAPARSLAETQGCRQAATRTCRRAATATRSQAKAQAKARHHNDSAGPTPQRRPLRHSAPAIPGPEAAAPSTALPHRHPSCRHHLSGGARCRGSATHFVPPPLKARTPSPQATPDRSRTARESTSSVPAPLPTLDLSPRTANAPLPPPARVPTQP